MKRLAAAVGAGLLAAANCCAAGPLAPFDGPTAAVRVDNRSLYGLVMCGYQGWFNAPGDGANRGFTHYRDRQGRFDADHASIDYWPDLSEADPDEKFPTALRHADGTAAEVFSSRHPKTVARHFRWMREYGIDGVFVQRFLGEVANPSGEENFNTVLTLVRAAANAEGRVWALMYDTSNCEDFSVFQRDWRKLTEEFKLGGDPAYLHFRGRPLAAVWGLFANRPKSPEFFRQAVKLMRESGFSVMLGTDSSWRTGRGAAADEVRAIIETADVLSPWTVGRYGMTEFPDYFERVVKPDFEYCRARGIDYLPVAFPGFSWWNLKQRDFDLIPRRGGEFFQLQLDRNFELGARMLYVAMFDEIDEGTAIMKVHPSPPVGGCCRFLSNAPQEPDHYLKLTGAAAARWKVRAEPPAADFCQIMLNPAEKIKVFPDAPNYSNDRKPRTNPNELVQGDPVMIENTLKKMKNPGSEFRGAPFWAWNGKLEPEELRRQIRNMKEMGLGGFFMHARVGLATPYLGEAWFECVRACVDEARKLGMNAWLYDEDRWPSGAAGGLVTKNPAYRERHLCCETGEESLKNADAESLGWFAVEVKANGGAAGYRKLADPRAALKPGETRFRFFRKIAGNSSWFNGQAYLDTMNEEAVRQFIEVTHEKYRKEIGDDFGKTVPGIFTDEPNYHHAPTQKNGKADGAELPWTDELPGKFRAKYGFELLDRLPELYLAVGDQTFSETRLHYYDLLTSLFVNAFSRQIGEWCGKNHLQFTGHALAEDTLTSQTNYVGAAMRFYEYMQTPGIDLLTEHWNIFTTAKQCSSAARQFGRRERLSETYGCTGWDFPFAGHKALGDWQFALGITLRCQHLYWYSMAAEAKRDYPASIAFQSPWYAEYPVVEDYFARLGAALAAGDEVRDLLVIHPIESTWGIYALAGMSPAVEEAENRPLIELVNQLLSAHLDFDFGDEELMSRHAEAAPDGRFRVGLAHYRTVLIPELRTIRAGTLRLLEAFRARGGAVFFLGQAPGFVDGRPSGEAAKAYARFTAVTRAGLESALSPAVRRVSLADQDGREIKALLYLLRQSADCRTLFVCNLGMEPNADQMKAPLVRDRKLEFSQVAVAVDGDAEDRVYELNLATGSLHAVPSEYRNGRRAFTTSFAALGSRLFLVTAKQLAAMPPRPAVTAAASRTPLPAQDWRIECSEDNVLVLDHARAAADGEALLSEPTYVIKIDDALRKKLGASPRGGAMVQPWMRADAKAPDRQLALELTYRFEVDTRPAGDCKLALERPDLYTIDLNGRPVATADSGYWVDPSLRCLVLPAASFQVGANVLTLKGRYHELLPGLETIYLLGRFGIRNDALTAMPDTLAVGDWCLQGLPYYAGSVTYVRTIRRAAAPTGPVELILPEWRGVALQIQVNAAAPVTLAWPPYALDIAPYLAPGDNRIAITVIGHRRNSHGPFYLNEKWPSWTGPREFKVYDHPARQLVPCGLLAAPELAE